MKIEKTCLFVAVALASAVGTGNGQFPPTAPPPTGQPPATQEATSRPSAEFEKWQGAYVSALAGVGALLRQTTDQHSALQARPKLDELAARLSKLITEGRNLKPGEAPYPDARAGALEAVINAQMYSVAGNPAVYSVLKPTLEQLSQALFGQGLSSPTTQPNWTFEVGSW